MPPRRSHKKSRAGCRRCKSRKIKCDEVHPRCGNCVKHGVPCDFENPDIIEELLASSATTSTSGSASTPGGFTAPSSAGSPFFRPSAFPDPRTPSITALSPAMTAFTPLLRPPSVPILGGGRGPQNRLLELRLMHQYTSTTSRTLVFNSPMTDEIWQNQVPRLAFGNAPYLADAMLAVAALHLRSFNPDDRALIRASHAYMASSLSEYCATLNKGIDESNADTLFLTATLIAFQSTATRIFIRDDADPRDPSSVYTLPLSWFHAFQGVKTVVASSWPWIRNSGIALPIIDSQPVLQLELGCSSQNSFFGHLLDNLEDEISGEMAQGASPQTTAATRQCYHHAVAVLNWAHKLPHRGAALAFPATVSKRYIELLEARRPRALAMLACFFALLKNIEVAWWLHGAARREVMGIVSQFEAASPWWSHLEWPVRIALYDGAIIPPDVWGADWVAEENKSDRPQGGAAGNGESFVDHIEILTGVMGKPPSLPGAGVGPGSGPGPGPVTEAPITAGRVIP